MARLVGILATQQVAPGDKFRVAWKLQLIPLTSITIISPVKAANVLLATLPLAGFAPVSNPSAKAGDLSVVIDVRLSSSWSASWTGKTAGNVVAALEALPQKAPLIDRLVLNDLTVDRVEKISLTTSSSDLETGQAGTQAETQQEQEQAGIFDDLKRLLDKVATGAGVVVALVVIAGAAYLYARSRR